MPEDGLVPIGELARRTGVATSALRYYERIGLLYPAQRAGGEGTTRRRARSGSRSFASARMPGSPSRRSVGCSPPGAGDVEAGVVWPSARSRSSTLASRTRSEQRSSSSTLSNARIAISPPVPVSALHSRLSSSVPVASTGSRVWVGRRDEHGRCLRSQSSGSSCTDAVVGRPQRPTLLRRGASAKGAGATSSPGPSSCCLIHQRRGRGVLRSLFPAGDPQLC